MKDFKTPIAIITIFLSMILTLQSCVFVSKSIETRKMKSEYTVENEAIPFDIGVNNDEVLLIQLVGKKSIDSYVKKAVEGYYFGKYEYIEPTEEIKKRVTARYIINPTIKIDKIYPNKTKYRFVFYDEGGSLVELKEMHTNRHISSVQRKRYSIYDRLKDEKISSGFESKFFGKSVKVYMEALNNQRLKNEKK